jgi:hypothetical protein
MTHPLVQVSEAVREQARNSRVAVIFDLDSTLFSVSPRTQAILRQLSREEGFSKRHQAVSEILRDVEVLPTDWGIRAVLERSRVQGGMELFKEVRNYWRQHFFANHFLEHDTIYPSADEYVRHLHELGAAILYLTGRNEGSMREGTVKMLKKWGFPLFHAEDLMMKPSDVQTDEGFKAQVLNGLAKKYDHIWFFENEPVIIAQVRGLVPQVRVVFVNSTHSGRAPAPTDLPTIAMSYREGLPKN